MNGYEPAQVFTEYAELVTAETFTSEYSVKASEERGFYRYYGLKTASGAVYHLELEGSVVTYPEVTKAEAGGTVTFVPGCAIHGYEL